MAYKSRIDVEGTTSQFERTMRNASLINKRYTNQIGDQWKRASGFAQKFTGILGAFGVGVGLYGIKRVIESSLEMADAIGKASDVIGISTDALQEYRHAAELSGVDTSLLDSSFQAFAKRIGELRQGTGALNTYLSKYDENLLNALKSTKSTEEALGLVFNRMGEMTNATDKAAFASSAFSRAGVKLVNVVKDGAEGLEGMRQEARDLGIIVGEDVVRSSEAANDALKKLKDVIGVSVTNAIGELAPKIEDLATLMTQKRGDIQAYAGDIVNVGLAALKAAGYVAKFFDVVGKGLGIAAARAMGYSADELEMVEKKIDFYKGEIARIKEQIEQQRATQSRLAGSGLLVDDSILRALDDQLIFAENRLRNFAKIRDSILGGPPEGGYLISGTDQDAMARAMGTAGGQMGGVPAPAPTQIGGGGEAEEEQTYGFGMLTFPPDFFSGQEERLQEHLDKKLEMINWYAGADYDIQTRHQQELADLEVGMYRTRVQAQQNWLQMGINILAAWEGVSGRKSKTIFALAKATEAAKATVAAFSAANQALAYPPAPNFALYTATLAMGLSNVAAIMGTAIGQIRGGGGGTISTGAASGVTVPAVSSEAVPVTGETGGRTNIYLMGDVLADDAYIERLAEKISEAVEAGSVRIVATEAGYAERLI